MTLNNRQKVGLAILAAITIAFLLWYFLVRPNGSDGPESITVVGYGGAVKAQFFENPEVTRILLEKYGITVDIKPDSTNNVLCKVPLEGTDFLWAGDQSQIETYEECRGRSDPYVNPVFNTPLVIYSWSDITDVLIDEGVVTVGTDGVYRADMVALWSLIDSGQTWDDLGLNGRHSRVLVATTNPASSTSGQMFMGLLANTMNCLEVVSSTTVQAVLPHVHEYVPLLGFVPDSSAQLFSLYISQGEGAYPLVALLESQIIESVVENPEMIDQVQDRIRIIYPEPTVWLTHPMITLTDEGRLLANALLDKEIQELGWPNQGFRPSVAGVQIDLDAIPIPGFQQEINSILSNPSNAVMGQIFEATLPEYVPDPNAPPLPVCEPDAPPPVGSPAAVRPGGP